MKKLLFVLFLLLLVLFGCSNNQDAKNEQSLIHTVLTHEEIPLVNEIAESRDYYDYPQNNFSCLYIENGKAYCGNEMGGSTLIEEADIESIVTLGSFYSIDKNSVYLGGDIIPGADPNSFENIVDFWGKDNSYAYFHRKRIEGSHVDAFEPLDNIYSKDNNSVFYEEREIVNADVQSFKIVDKNYSLDKDAVYYKGVEAEKANPDTFYLFKIGERRGGNYARDGDNVYREGSKTNISPQGLAFLLSEGCNGMFVKDDQNVYWDYSKVYREPPILELLEGVDAETFQLFPNGVRNDCYFKDVHSVYKNMEVIEHADPQTFTLKNAYYNIDKDHVFYRRNDLERIIPGALPESFETLSPEFSRDAKRIYVWEHVLHEADPETFEYITDVYAKDKDHVFARGEIVEGADVETFVVTGGGTGKDKNYTYHEYERTGRVGESKE